MSIHTIQQMSTTITGSGPDLLMIHGLGGSAHIFEALTQECSRDYRVIRPELPGSARSPTPLSSSIEAQVNGIEALMRVLSIKRIHLVGHSLGTLICQQIAIRNSGLVASLLLYGPLTEPPDAARQALLGRAELVRQEGMQSVIDAVLDATTSSHTRANKPIVMAFLHQLLEAQDARGYALNCEVLAAANAVDSSQIHCPTQLITGADDRITPPGMMSILADQIRDSRSQIVANCGHWTLLEAADSCVRQSRTFLNSVSR